MTTPFMELDVEIKHRSTGEPFTTRALINLSNVTLIRPCPSRPDTMMFVLRGTAAGDGEMCIRVLQSFNDFKRDLFELLGP